MTQTHERFWRRRARGLAWRANFGFWFAWFAPAAAAAIGTAAPLLLLARRAGRDGLVTHGLAAAVVAAAFLAAWRVRRTQLEERDGLVWLEARLALHNGLSAAAAGVGPWPGPDRYEAVFPWRGLRAATPLAFAAALFTAVSLVPLSAPEAAAIVQPEPPLSWRQTDEWIQSLKQTEVAQVESVRSFEESLGRLQAQPSESWYGESGLEAADSLRDQLRSEIRSLASDLDTAAGALDGAADGTRPGEAERRRIDAAARGLSSRSLRLRADLLQKLRDAAKPGRRLAALDAGTLARSLRENAGFCRLALRECREGDVDCLRVARRGRGRGGIDRGPGPAPLTLDPEASGVEARRMEGISNPDLRHAALGDVVETTTARHRVSVRPRGVTSGGTAAAGTGGDAVSRSPLTPEERRILARYFK